VTTPEARKRNVRLTVFALLGVIMLIVGMFVRQFVSPDRLDPEWLRVHGAVLFDPPRSFERPGSTRTRSPSTARPSRATERAVLRLHLLPRRVRTTLALRRDAAGRCPARTRCFYRCRWIRRATRRRC
jgi:hypothetical protein